MPGGAGREDYSAMPEGGSGASRGRQDREGSGYYDRPANRARLQNQQARINQMQSRGEGIFGRPAKQSFLSGIGQKFKDWAGNMRGGINPLTNEYYTQEEYKDNVQARRDRARIDRIRKTKDLYDTGVIDRDWDQSPLKNRLAGLEEGQWNRMNAMGMPIGTTKPGEEVAEEMIYPERKPFVPPASEYEGMWNNQGINQTNSADEWFRNNPEVAQMMRQSNAARRNLPITERWANQTGMDLQEAKAYNTEDMKALLGITDKTTAGEQIVDPYMSSPKFIEGTRGDVMSKVYENMLDITKSNPSKSYASRLEHSKMYGIPPEQQTLIPSDYLTSPADLGTQKPFSDIAAEIEYPYELAQGGRVGYNTGGRVGILSIF